MSEVRPADRESGEWIVSVKRYSNAVGVSHLSETFDSVNGKPRGDFVYSRDYDALQVALREALDGWNDCMQFGLDKKGRERNFKCIAELRKFLDDK